MPRPHALLPVLTTSALLLALLAPLALADEAIRVVTWNVESIGAQGSAEYNAALDVLKRIGADVVAVQEIASTTDADHLLSLASDLQYNYATVAPGGPFGSDRAAFMSDLPLLADTSWTAAQLSGDPAANDLTRYILEAEIDVTGQGDLMTLVVNHWKSGGANADEYRRAIETQRMVQVVSQFADDTPFVLMGDVNADVRDGSPTPLVFTEEPTADLPTDFVTGADIRAQFINGGLPNDPFPPLAILARMLDAKQVDGNYATRPSSGRRLDYLFASPTLYLQGAQVYDCGDEGLMGGLPLEGQPLPATTCIQASDHLPVFADLIIPTGGVTPFADVPPTSWAYGYIHAIRDAGITGGCGNGNYCPQGLVTREQMAAFLVRAVEGEPAANYCDGSSSYSDVAPDAWSCRYIKRLAELNITGGCGGDNYCPQGLVTRDQMAAFIVRAVAGEPAPDYCGGVAPFQDVAPSTFFCGYIKRLVELGITQGCGNGNYCPGNEVNREQMAVFLARAFLDLE